MNNPRIHKDCWKALIASQRARSNPRPSKTTKSHQGQQEKPEGNQPKQPEEPRCPMPLRLLYHEYYLPHRYAWLAGSLAALAICLATLGVIAGYDGGSQRVGVSGRVSLDGEPLLASGIIRFDPADASVPQGSGGTMEAGQYSIAAVQGLQPGRYLVSICTYRETGRIIHDPQRGDIIERVPVCYEEVGRLDATVVHGGRNRFDFALTCVPSPTRNGR
jgi:hypothetical protein